MPLNGNLADFVNSCLAATYCLKCDKYYIRIINLFSESGLH